MIIKKLTDFLKELYEPIRFFNLFELEGETENAHLNNHREKR